MTLRGSPPRVWGNHSFKCGIRGHLRFTPTRVGKSQASPRLSLQSFGSPPRVWGNHAMRDDRHLILTVHPHACGEITARQIGEIYSDRFTPTRVGKSNCTSILATPDTVHPHACGDISSCLQVQTMASGSPPRVWGNQLTQLYHNYCRRFTPTRVGKSHVFLGDQNQLSVHPHACGEIAWDEHAVGLAHGSPPRVWGNLHPSWYPIPWQRFTPTRVGKSRFSFFLRSRSSVHPHACGEIRTSSPEIFLFTGSPPRVWGNRCVPLK